MAEDSDLERTEPASSRRLEQAREEGQVPQSRDLSTFLVLISGTVALWVTGSWMSQRLSSVLSRGLAFGHAEAFDSSLMGKSLENLSNEAVVALLPLFLALIIGAVAGPFAIGGAAFTPTALEPKFSRLNPMSFVGRVFSWNGVAELLKSLAKVTIVGLVVWWVVRQHQEQLFSLFGASLRSGLATFVDLLFFSTLMIVSGMALVAAVDVPFQLWQYHEKLKMTKEELRQESKEQEGDPHVKGRIRNLQREMARKRMMSEVPKADVVVTNPTHFAVALKYDSASMGAPRVVAKGVNLVAARIRELAQENNIPLVEAPPLARALYRHTEPGDEIPATLYTVVAEIMAYVYQLNQYLAQGGSKPSAPKDLAVPDGLDPGAE